MDVKDIKRVLIIGAGTMGQQIGLQVALCGFDVVLYDLNQKILDIALKRIEKLGSQLIKLQKTTEDKLNRALAKITTSIDPEDASFDVDFVSESVPEDPHLKAKIFAEFNSYCKERTIFTTNTSSLLPSMFAKETGRPDKFAALHFHDIRITNIVDVMPHPHTSKETLNVIVDFAYAIGQRPIVLKKENPGYIFNAMFMEWLKAALTLAANEVATIEDIDMAWQGVMNYPSGPFKIMDNIGLDTVYKVTEYWANKTNDKQSKKNLLFLKKYIDAGKLGIKTCEGFYSYNL